MVDNAFRRAVAFTGHRMKSFQFTSEEDHRCRAIKSALLIMIDEMYGVGIREYLIGCALGADTWAGEAVLTYREKNDLSLHCIIPFPGWDCKWTDEDRERMRRILEAADEQKIIATTYERDTYRKRNYYLVDNSEYLIAVYNPCGVNRRSGTSMTVNYAIKKGRAIYFVHPDSAEITRPAP